MDVADQAQDKGEDLVPFPGKSLFPAPGSALGAGAGIPFARQTGMIAASAETGIASGTRRGSRAIGEHGRQPPRASRTSRPGVAMTASETVSGKPGSAPAGDQDLAWLETGIWPGWRLGSGLVRDRNLARLETGPSGLHCGSVTPRAAPCGSMRVPIPVDPTRTPFSHRRVSGSLRRPVPRWSPPGHGPGLREQGSLR